MLWVGSSSGTSDYATAVITQDYTTTFSLIGTLEEMLPPPITAVANLTDLIGSYRRVNTYVQEGAIRGFTVEDGYLIAENAGTYVSTTAYATFIHPHNNAVASFVFGVERNGLTSFSQRPLVAETPNNDEPVTVTGGGQLVLESGDKLSVWIASSITGLVKIINSNLTIIRIA